jgi:MSHA biogenesis protein MshQ
MSRQVAPFTADIDFLTTTIVDTDGVNATDKVAASPIGVEIRFGRLLIENSFGPETEDFP